MVTIFYYCWSRPGTIQSVGENKDLEVWDTFWGVVSRSAACLLRSHQSENLHCMIYFTHRHQFRFVLFVFLLFFLNRINFHCNFSVWLYDSHTRTFANGSAYVTDIKCKYDYNIATIIISNPWRQSNCICEILTAVLYIQLHNAINYWTLSLLE